MVPWMMFNCTSPVNMSSHVSSAALSSLATLAWVVAFFPSILFIVEANARVQSSVWNGLPQFFTQVLMSLGARHARAHAVSDERHPDGELRERARRQGHRCCATD